MADKNSYVHDESAKRSQKVRTEFGRDRSDDDSYSGAEAQRGDLSGDPFDLSMSIKNGKVPSE